VKVLVSDNLSNVGVDILKNTPGIEVDVNTGLSEDELIKIIGNYNGLAVRSATKATKKVLDAAVNLKVIGRAGIGVDNIDVAEATKKGIIVMNTPGGNTITTAEHAVSMMLSMTRNIPQATASMKSGKWEKKKFSGVEIYSKTLGIIGIGNIGSIVADRAHGLKMKVVAYDPFITEEKATELEIELVSLDDLYKRADFISIHTPLNDDTRGMVNKEAFDKMKDGVMVLNCARGGIINEDDLYDAVVSGKVASAALDVFAKEPPGEHKLFELDKVICTPHLGASTDEAQVNVAVAVAEQIADYLLHGTILNSVNVPSVSAELLQSLRPYITLGEKLGSVLAQSIKGGIKELTIEYSGEVASSKTAPITTSVLKGFLSILTDTVNFVNAPVVAKERGIKVKETSSKEVQDYANLITVTTVTDEGSFNIAGTVFGKNDLRIVRVHNYAVESVPEGNILMLMNYDKPGVIGNTGTTLGKHGINIAAMNFGRESKGHNAISLINVDEDVSQEVISEILKLPNIISAKLLKL
jgi:D-3-phosphoglycerate dehydrogenase